MARASEGQEVAVPARTARERASREARRRSRLHAARQAVHTLQQRRRRRDNIAAIVAFVLVAALATAAQIGYVTVGPGAPPPKSKASASPTPTPTPSGTVPPKALAQNRAWSGSLTLNSVKLGITLDGKRAPQAVANFVSLADKGFYNGLTCHRLTTKPYYVLQCGDPAGDGSGGPGYSFGPVENAPKNGIYPTGVIAMGRGSSENSQGSQFFIVYRTSGFGAGNDYTVFGKVTSGLPALQSAITSKGVAAGTGPSPDDGRPKVTTKITALSVH
jgi:peptidyl-prolyl cis-trans isomerase B (cyclophilin B)